MTSAKTPLTLAQMRQDIADMLHEDPSDIHDDDNLVDLGLDSMRIMTLASRWRDTGAAVQFADMAAVTTLAQWWTLIQRAQAATASPE